MPNLRLQTVQHCTETGKLRFKTEQEALNRANVITRSDPKKRPRNAYRCETCGDWHVTSFHEYRPKVDDGTAPRVNPRPRVVYARWATSTPEGGWDRQPDEVEAITLQPGDTQWFEHMMDGLVGLAHELKAESGAKNVMVRAPVFHNDEQDERHQLFVTYYTSQHRRRPRVRADRNGVHLDAAG